jgi:hypothetical protein
VDFIPHADATELIQSSEGAFHNPAPSPQPATMSGIAHCEQGKDVADTQGMADALRVVGPVSTMRSGRQRGRPRGPWSGVMASSNDKALLESWQFAPVSWIANGMPSPSQIKWRLLPRLARSVGFGPVCSPQKSLSRKTVNNGARPVDLASTRKPVQQYEMHQVPDSGVLPIGGRDTEETLCRFQLLVVGRSGDAQED